MLIFLDIDGVLNTQSDWQHPYTLNTLCMKNFCQYVKKVNGQIILTSSWRKGFIASHHPDNLVHIRLLETKYGLPIIDKTPVLKGRKRNDEIERYLYFYPTNSYIIIDDDKSEFSKISKYNYFVDHTIGFSKKDIRGCMKCIL